LGEIQICPGSVVLLNGKPYCTAADVATACANAGQDPSTSVELFAFDHIYPGASTRAPVAVLYADVGDELTAQLHASLKQAAALGQVRYVFRHYYTNRSEAIPLRGYGVELALKSVEYKVMDTSLFAGSCSVCFELCCCFL
jgi:UDP-glucose:glycoprotein glucosyltransferase